MSKFNLIAVALIAIAVPAAAFSADKDVQKQQKSGRRIASLSAAPAKFGQGELMLRNLRTNHPSFLSAAAKSSGPVQVAGVCRDNFGRTHYSHERGYTTCVDSQSVTAGSGSVNGYFGPSQRQAGVGILVTQ